MVADGKWLDYTDIAILNDDSSKAQVNIAALKEAFYVSARL